MVIVGVVCNSYTTTRTDLVYNRWRCYMVAQDRVVALLLELYAPKQRLFSCKYDGPPCNSMGSYDI